MCIYWKAWIGNDDNEVEGVWETWYTDQVTFCYCLFANSNSFCYCVFANSNSSAGGVSTLGSRPTIWWCPKPQLHVAQGHCIFKSSICSVSVFKIYISSLFTNVPGKPGGLRYNIGKNKESEYGGSGMRESPSRLRHLRGRRACQEGQYKRALRPLHLW